MIWAKETDIKYLSKHLSCKKLFPGCAIQEAQHMQEI